MAMIFSRIQLEELLSIMRVGDCKAIMIPGDEKGEVLYQSQDGRWLNAFGHERTLSTK
jgi:hypothetical protein